MFNSVLPYASFLIAQWEKNRMINIESYYKGFMDGVECKDNYKIRLLGYDLTELLKIVNDHAMRKHEIEKGVLSKPTLQEIFNMLGMTNDDLVEAHNRKYSPMPTKAKMTRAEAVNLLGLHCLSPKTDVEAMISFYIAAGMLEIVEETKVRDMVECLYDGFVSLTSNGLKDRLAVMGYKIVLK